jgi:hypothetical protein
MPKVPFALGFFASAPSNTFFIFGLVEIAFAALGAAGAWIYAEVFAEVLVALRLFEFVFGHVVNDCAVYVIAWAVVDV